MAQIINQNSTPQAVQTEVLKFVYTAPDGSRQVNADGLTAWLAEQFSYLPVADVSLPAKSTLAAAIVRNLDNSIGRAAMMGRDDYPRGVATEINAEVTDKLAEIRDDLRAEAKKIHQGYEAFRLKMMSSVAGIFSASVADKIAGVTVLKTTRAYIETFVTDRGEESRPSPASALFTLDQNDSATVTGSAAPAGRNITRRRLYRSATGAATSSWRLQGEYPIAQTIVPDTKPDTELNDVCITFGWQEPPAALQGLARMSNGILVGYVGSTIHACEPYYSYAWPAKYDKPLPHQITGLVSMDQSALVGTTGYPYVLTGSDSASLTEQKLKNRVPCASGRSMVAIGDAVFYASSDGLALYEAGNVSVVTEGIIDRAAWAAYNPASMLGAGFDGRYFAFYTKADASRGCLVFDYKSRTIAELAQVADAAFADESGLYALNGTQILNVLPLAGTGRAGAWHSKTFVLAKPQHFAWLQADSGFSNNGSAVPVTVRVYGDGALLHTAVITSRAAVRLPPGRFTNWRLEIESSALVNGIIMASTTDELKAAA